MIYAYIYFFVDVKLHRETWKDNQYRIDFCVETIILSTGFRASKLHIWLF